MKRNIIHIDREKCDGCGICIDACHEQALVLVDGKAMLVSDSYCDGLGDCLPACPQDAIRMTQRDAAPYDDDAVQQRLEKISTGCPSAAPLAHLPAPVSANADSAPSQLATWPVQLALVAENAPFLEGADLLIAADCTAFAYGDFHRDFLANRVGLIACPKLDTFNYVEKLAGIFSRNTVASVTVLRMEVPCCGGLARMVEQALQQCGKKIPWTVRTLSLKGELLGQ